MLTDAVTNAVRRKAGLDNARKALRLGGRSALQAALRALPPDGRKAERLRARIDAALGSLGDEAVHFDSPPASSSVLAIDGIRYEFSIAETGDLAAFVPSRTGRIVRVVINSAHPYGRSLGGEVHSLGRNAQLLLASWAHHELDQVNEQRQARARDSRIDWSRVLRRLSSCSDE